MAAETHPPRRVVDMRALRRLALWGTSAGVALSVAVLAGSTESGSQRFAGMSGSAPAVAQKTSMVVQLAARSAEAEAETQRLAERVRLLISDREWLVARIGVIERNLEDLTGSIARRNQPLPPTPDSTVSPAAPEKPSPERSAALPESVPATSAPLAPEPDTAPPPRPAAEPVPAGGAAQHENLRADIGADIGGAVSFDGLRALWISAKNHNAALLDGLHPIVAVRENNRSKNPELRLIVGPFETPEAAARLCAALSAARRYCQPVAFEGQRLAQADDAPVPVPERKPASPKPAAKPAQQAPRSVWPFR